MLVTFSDDEEEDAAVLAERLFASSLPGEHDCMSGLCVSIITSSAALAQHDAASYLSRSKEG